MDDGSDQAAPDVQARIRDSFGRQGLMRLLGARMDHIAPGRVHIVLPSRPEVTQQHGDRLEFVQRAVEPHRCFSSGNSAAAG